MFSMNNLTQEQHLGLPRGGTWCGATNAPGVVADIRPVCATCHIKAMHAVLRLLDVVSPDDAAVLREWFPEA